ncbi:hypothetical protein [Corallococcus caeni]|uniref:Lipoprotein n=1 Tax=Corallococcus caeni TaxID=3082388 RepID=A0ABQ6QV15_9BACT|nr:hypothetical protein ASNO1_41300 [Corallococcus sp. NO1]
MLALFVALRANPGDAHEETSQVERWTRSLVSAGLTASSVKREALGGGLAHYTWKVRVGTGKYDVIGVHRVVREARPWIPARSSRAVFLVHGDLWGFAPAFLTNTCVSTMPEDRSLAAFLASQDVDVWGLDLRWVGVPEEETDFEFMAAWSIQTHAKDLGTGLALADVVRRLSGNGGNDRMFLMGWSRGATIGYAYLDAESQRPRALRRVDGFVPMDMPVRFGPDAAQQQQWACERYELLNADRAMGRTEGGLLGPAPGIPVRHLGWAAAQDPNGLSLLAPGFVEQPRPTNRQLAVIAAGDTATLLRPFKLQPLVPGYHLAGSVPDASGLPVKTAYTPEPTLFDYFQLAVPYQSLNEVVETEAQLCGLDVPFDDHLQDVKVPVLYVGAAGGVGRYGEYSTRLLGSTDVTRLIVRSRGESERALDFGHADLFLARDARVRVWQPILQWLRAH